MKNKSVLSVILKVLYQNIFMLLILILLIIGVVLGSLLPPCILKSIIDDYLSSAKGDKLLVPAVLYLLTIFLVGIFEFSKETMLTIYGQQITNAIRSEMMSKLKRIPSSYLSKHDSGIIVSQFVNDVDTIQNLFTNGVVSMVVDSLKIVGIVITIWFFSIYLGIMTLLILPVLFFVTRYFQAHMLKEQIKNRTLIGIVNNHIPDTVSNMEIIKVFHKEKYMEKKYKKNVLENYKTVEKVNFYDAIFSPIVIIIRAILIAVMVILCSRQIAILGISVGMVAAAIELLSNLFSPIENLGMEIQSIQQAIAGVRHVNEFLLQEEEMEKTGMVNIQKLALNFEHVGFGYESEQTLFLDFNLHIKQNEKVVFKGRTGAGKSTLFKLILGLIEPTEGKITINDTDVTTIPSSEKRKLFGFVEQQFSSVPGNIKEQITLGDQTICEDSVRKVMQFVGLDEFVMVLDNKYLTDMKAASFSNGQCQLLSIARALIMDPPIILLDEMTANLDSETEKKIIQVLLKAVKNRMLLSISHRLSFSFTTDKTVIIEEGKIIIDENGEKKYGKR